MKKGKRKRKRKAKRKRKRKDYTFNSMRSQAIPGCSGEHTFMSATPCLPDQ